MPSERLNLLPENVRVTQATFDRLPAVLTSYQVCLLGGWTRHELSAEVKLGQIKTFQPAYLRTNHRTGRAFKSTRRKYTKASVAARLGFTL